MVQSMTGFGKAQINIPGKSINIEIKSLNSKQQDLSVRMPGVYKSKEMQLRNRIIKSLSRGKIEFSMYVESTGDSLNSKVNLKLVNAYFQQLKPALDTDKITPEVLSTIMRFPDVMHSEKEEISEEEWSQIIEGVDEALVNINQFRSDEGASLEKDMLDRVASIEQGLEDVIKCDVIRIQNIKDRLQNSISEIKDNLVDKNRFEQELIYYLEKLDINEEKVRLKQHCAYFRETIINESSMGKKLGFISQEMGREINTTGSKANDADIQKTVVMMKDDLEKIKEQVLNVL
tara:strand:- start:1523 stop:2389 length:867 start_codon:yes stop_codon:yes gene_type:complete